MKRIIAVNSNCYHGYTIGEAVAGIRKAGFRADGDEGLDGACFSGYAL